MSVIAVMERVNSRPLVNDPKAYSAVREYWAQCDDPATDPIEVNDAIAAESPNFYLGLIKKSIVVDPQGGGFWYGKVSYGVIEGGALEGQGGPAGSPEAPPELTDFDVLGPSYAFSTTGGTQHITQSLNTLVKQRLGGGAVPDNMRAIGATKDGVAGCDIIAPKFEFSVTKRIAFLTMRYVRQLVEATGTVNRFDWNTLRAGEVLFMGCEGQYDGNGNDDHFWMMTYKFAVSKNVETIAITDGLVIAEGKRGWDYLWVGFAEEVDANTIIQRPLYAYVEEVYDHTDFRQLLGF